MGYWEDAESQSGGPKSSPGWHHYKVTGVLRGSKTRTFRSRSGDDQLLVVLTDEDGGEATAMFTLSDRAAWSLAKFLSRAGLSPADLDREGIKLSDWSDEEFAKERLEGRLVWANCEHEQAGDKTYTRLNFAHADEVPAEIAMSIRAESEPPSPEEDDDDDIPF